MSKLKYRVDKDYCSSPIWVGSKSVSLSDLELSAKSLYWLNMYDDLWEQVMENAYKEYVYVSDRWINQLRIQVAKIVQDEHPELDIYPKEE